MFANSEGKSYLCTLLKKLYVTNIQKMDRKLLLHIIIFPTVLLFPTFAMAQFTLNPTSATKLKTMTDTIRMLSMDSLSVTKYRIKTDAYERYVRRETFRYRNKVKLRSTLGITQTSFSNWAAGGANSFSGRLWLNFEHTYTNDQSAFNVISLFEGAYTMVITDEKVQKSEDFFYLSSTPSWKLAPNWEVSGSFVLKSQFTDGFVSPGDTLLSSSFFAPAYLTLSAGITYTMPNKRFKAFVAPLSGNSTLLLNDELSQQGLFGVEVGKSHKSEFGAFTRLEYNQPLFKNTTLIETKVESFWNYADLPTLWWENRISYKLNNIFNVALYVKVLYDRSVETPKASENNYWQINQSLSFNFMLNYDSKANTGPLEFY